MSVDPVATDWRSGGNFNRYWYANNNPYRFTDPDGRYAQCTDTACTITVNGPGDIILMSPTMLYVASVYASRLIENVVTDLQQNESAGSDTPTSAGEKVREGTQPARGVSGKKGEREGSGGQDGADGTFDSVDGTNERSPRDGVRVKDLDGGGTIETHPSSKSPDYPKGTPTVKVQDANGQPTTTVRYPQEDKQ